MTTLQIKDIDPKTNTHVYFEIKVNNFEFVDITMAAAPKNRAAGVKFQTKERVFNSTSSSNEIDIDEKSFEFWSKSQIQNWDEL